MLLIKLNTENFIRLIIFNATTTILINEILKDDYVKQSSHTSFCRYNHRYNLGILTIPLGYFPLEP